MSDEATTACIKFLINGVQYSVGPKDNVGPKTALADFIRDVANLKGTKIMCREGGCGACLVMAKVIDPNTGSEVTKSVNSCLTPVLSCDGWDISTVERLGNKQEGYHVVQNRIVNFHGTQCGFCTPGMVMNMYSLLEGNKDLKMEDIEKNFDGNICRCTGYRPIMDAFKSLTNDASEDLRKKCADIEDCATCPLKKENGNVCRGKVNAQLSTNHSLKLKTGENWVTAKTLESALTTAAQNAANGSIRFVAGNTSTGIFKTEGPFQTFIDVNGIPELKKTSVDSSGITIGGGTTLTEVISLLKNNSKLSGFEYGEKVAMHLERVANISVRNNGTIAGNLMIKHKYQEFPSDVFVMLEALGATLTIVGICTKKRIINSETVSVETLKPISLIEFLGTDMNLKLVTSIHLPKREGYHFRSFKITRRYQNAHAYVNAALLLKVNKDMVLDDKPRLVYGGISASFIHASATEESLLGKNLADSKTLADALLTLEKEVNPQCGPLESSQEYRRQLVKALLYKTILGIVGNQVSQKLQSGAVDIIRKLIKGKQTFDTDATDVALYKAVPKYEASIQASGEAEYTGDIPVRPDELFGAFVVSTVACADLIEMDASEALKIPGVVRFVTAKDIPGESNTKKFNYFPPRMAEPVFAIDKVYYCGQSLGLILATSTELAAKAAKLVKVKYANEKTPIVNIHDAIEKAKSEGTYAMQTFGKYSKPNNTIKVAHTVKGTVRAGAQYHFYMETQSVVCHPREDGIDVYSSTQYMDQVQNTIALALNIPSNSVNVQVRRLGGGFGGKASASVAVATACAAATWVTNRPVRVIMDLETNMSMFGIRGPYEIPYEVGFDDNGRIGSLKVDLINDTGFSLNEPTVFIALIHIQNVYKAIGWEVDSHIVSTNTPSHTTCRAPGSIKAIAAIEWIMDHIAHYLKKDPLEVRQINLLETGDDLLFVWGAQNPVYERQNLLPPMIEQMKSETDYEVRKTFIETFNKENRWKKRGMAVVPVRYSIDYFTTNFPASIAIYHMDGHVAVSHAGIEMGQGLNTKVIQTVAQALQVPMDRIKVKPCNNFVGANAYCTCASITSEIVCYAVLRACDEIKENLRPIMEKLENPTWDKLIAEAHTANVKLTASYTPTPKDNLKGYDVWVLNVTEVEIDVLTGEYKIVRTDLYEDTGKSLSPAVDLGQVEGGYIMGQGYFTTEKIVHDKSTGKLLTNGTWDYKPPECKDIPEDFRVTLLCNAPNPHGVLRSKATGEPSLDSAYAVVLAMRNAIASARKDAGNDEWFELDGPVTPEDIARLCHVNDSQLTF